MLDKIKQLLGEELSEQVAQKLGDVELAIANDGSYLPADKHDRLKADYKALEEKYGTEIAGFKSKLEEVQKNADDHETLKASLDEAHQETQKLMDKYESDKKDILIDSALKVELIKNNIKEPYVDMAIKQVKRDDLKIDGSDVLGVKDAVKGLVAGMPDLFGSTKIVGAQPSGEQASPIKTKKAELIDQYNAAEKRRDASAMFSIKQKIKELRE